VENTKLGKVVIATLPQKLFAILRLENTSGKNENTEIDW
jgi:hypothetical protein